MDLSSFSHSCIYAGNTCTQKLAEGEVEVPVEEGADINYITRLDTIEAGAFSVYIHNIPSFLCCFYQLIFDKINNFRIQVQYFQTCTFIYSSNISSGLKYVYVHY